MAHAKATETATVSSSHSNPTTQPTATATSAKTALRTLDGYDAQNAALTPRDEAPGDGPQRGGIQVLAGAGRHENASETTIDGKRQGQLTSTLLEELLAGQGLTTAMDRAMERYAVTGESHTANFQAMTGVKSGASDAGAGKSKAAVYVANVDYPAMAQLPGAATDAEGMQSALIGRGYRTLGFGKNLKAAEIEKNMTQLPERGVAGAGDELVLYYAGHGVAQGAIGVDEQVAKYANILPTVHKLAGQGVGVKVILDACESAGASDMVRQELLDIEARAAGEGSDAAGVAAIVKQLTKIKANYGGSLVNARRTLTMEIETFAKTAASVAELQVGVQKAIQVFFADISRWWANDARPKVMAQIAKLPAHYQRVASLVPGNLTGVACLGAPDQLDKVLNEILRLAQQPSAQ